MSSSEVLSYMRASFLCGIGVGFGSAIVLMVILHSVVAVGGN